MTLYLVRHGSAGDRKSWTGDDAERPLDELGTMQAEHLATMLAGAGIERLLSSHYARCRQTLEPLARSIDGEIELDHSLGEGNGVGSVAALLRDLAHAGTTAALCTHGDLIPATIRLLGRDGMVVGGERGSKKGSTWVLTARDGEIVHGVYARQPADLARVSV